jgi:hypothetical protein
MFTLIPMVESLARTISNLSRWSLNLLLVSIILTNHQDRMVFKIGLNIFHMLDKIRQDVLKNILNQAIMIPMGKRLYLYFHIVLMHTIMSYIKSSR